MFPRLLAQRALLPVVLFVTVALSRLPAQNAVTPHIKQVYNIDCAFCHGENGNGKTDAATSMSLTLLDWTDPKSLAGKSDQELFDTIRKGKDKMPPEDEGRAKDADIHGLITYIRGMSKGGAQTAATPTAPPPGTR